MTKVTILGEQPQKKKDLKPIEATLYYSMDSMNLIKSRDEESHDLSEYDSIQVIKTSFYDDIDCVIIADNGQIFLGKFNDGIV